VYLSLAPSDKRLVSAVPDYFFVVGLATMAEAVSEEERILRIPWDCII
jgi:hypothetical protein